MSIHFVQNWRDQDLSRMVADLLSLAGCAMLLVFGTTAWFSAHHAYALTLYAFSGLSLLNFLLYKRFGNWLWYRNTVISLYSFLLMVLVISGGENESAILWCYAYPLMAFPIIGHRAGAWVIGILAACAITVMYVPELFGASYSYSMDFRHRFAGSLFFVSLMAFILERARFRANEKTRIAMELLHNQANRDDLTGAYNRRGIRKLVEHELHRVNRDRTELSLVLCDIDFFKKINDTHGHDVGDLALKKVSQTLAETVRVTDMVGRWGGEEFLIVLPNTSLHKGYQLIERVRQQLAQHPIVLEGVTLNLSISCGICSTRFFSSFDDLIRAADQSLYVAKAEGRNCTRPALAKAS